MTRPCGRQGHAGSSKRRLLWLLVAVLLLAVLTPTAHAAQLRASARLLAPGSAEDTAQGTGSGDATTDASGSGEGSDVTGSADAGNGSDDVG